MIFLHLILLKAAKQRPPLDRFSMLLEVAMGSGHAFLASGDIDAMQWDDLDNPELGFNLEFENLEGSKHTGCVEWVVLLPSL